MRYVNNSLKKQGYGGLVCSMSEQLFKAVLVKNINKFLASDEYCCRESTSISGKTVGNYKENVFVLSDKVRATREFGSCYGYTRSSKNLFIV